MTFSSNFLHAVTFLHVLHLDILRRQIEIETESSMAIMLDPPMAIPIYTVLPYCVIVRVLMHTFVCHALSFLVYLSYELMIIGLFARLQCIYTNNHYELCHT